MRGIVPIMPDKTDYDPLVYGACSDELIVAVELLEHDSKPDEVAVFFRKDGSVVRESDSFNPFILCNKTIESKFPFEHTSAKLKGQGALNTMLTFPTWKDCVKAKKWFASESKKSPHLPAPIFFFINDPIEQYLILSGRTLFKGLAFHDLVRMQIDIECYTSEGFEFCNADREGDCIIAIALSDSTGWSEVLSATELSEKELLKRFVELVNARDPDVIEGHNIFNFDLSYILKRAKRHRVKLSLGRDGSVVRVRNSRLNIAERTVAYSRCDIFGRHVVDTMYLLQAYDLTRRDLDGYGLKKAAIHFGFASKDRTYIDGSKIASEYDQNPELVMKYVKDDVLETGKLSELLSTSYFIQTSILPYSYQNVCVRGNATKIDALMLREFLRHSCAIPLPGMSRSFEGGYTDMFKEGVIGNVHHCDIRSLYPSLMLAQKLQPESDTLGVFLKLLDNLRAFRLQAKTKMLECESSREKTYYDSLQSTFKIFINSFYGYLGFSQGHFNDYNAAETIAAEGRKLLKSMIAWLENNDSIPIEIDTDGIYYVPPKEMGQDDMQEYRDRFAKSLPDGIDVEFDGEYKSMFSYKSKNYALLGLDGEKITIKGAALKSRGLEPFQRDFLKEIIRCKLTAKDNELHRIKDAYEAAIRDGKWGIDKFAKTETLKDSPSLYAKKLSAGKRSRSAVYELALRSERAYRAGDQISFYVAGKGKKVAVYEAAKLVSEWDPKNRDENISYYQRKLDTLYAKFVVDDQQRQLGLDL